MKSRFYRRRRQKEHSFPEVCLTPLIDTALTLLIIFMITTPVIKKENALQVELPKGKVTEIDDGKKQDIIVSLDKQGKIFLNGKAIQEKEILDRLKKQIGNLQERTVFVKADIAAQYGKVIELVDKIKHVSGVRYVALATAKAT